jgi:chromosome segregation ATPase
LRESDLARNETAGAGGGELEVRAQELAAREKQLAEREAALAEAAEMDETARARAEKREKRLSETESSFRHRTRELDDREEEMERREARYETDFEIRLEKLEAREQAVAELEERLGAKENQLANYVAQAQGALQRRESEWWNKQLGSDEEDAA